MNEIVAQMRHPELWVVSVQLLVLYVVSVTVFYGVDFVWSKIADGCRQKVAAGSGGHTALVLVAALAGNFIGVATLTILARKVNTVPRLAMVLVPMFLLVERHVRAQRANPADRRLRLLGALGVIGGMAAGMAVFMKGAPWK